MLLYRLILTNIVSLYFAVQPHFLLFPSQKICHTVPSCCVFLPRAVLYRMTILLWFHPLISCPVLFWVWLIVLLQYLILWLFGLVLPSNAVKVILPLEEMTSCAGNLHIGYLVCTLENYSRMNNPRFSLPAYDSNSKRYCYCTKIHLIPPKFENKINKRETKTNGCNKSTKKEP